MQNTSNPQQPHSSEGTQNTGKPESHLTREDLKKEASVAEYVNAAAASSKHARNAIIVLIIAYYSL